MIYYSTTVTEVGVEVHDLMDGGVLILYADGAPPALAEVSIQHKVSHESRQSQPAVGDIVSIGDLCARITAMGDTAWNKVTDLGHVVLSFNGCEVADRPGEICVEPLDPEDLKGVVVSGCRIEIAG
ncbi:MAG: hypothetical protein RJA36_3200 [Pseudomonadota bacterium]|jgi:PTS system glucitol/sorbitol-specific IIA component